MSADFTANELAVAVLERMIMPVMFDTFMKAKGPVFRVEFDRALLGLCDRRRAGCLK